MQPGLNVKHLIESQAVHLKLGIKCLRFWELPPCAAAPLPHVTPPSSAVLENVASLPRTTAVIASVVQKASLY
jgi:hypothetical protein